jgi:hypothetical protein
VDVDEERPFVTAISEPEDHGETGGIAKDSADLTRWLLRKIGRYEEFADRDLRGYVENALQAMQVAYSLDALHRMKYQIRDRLQQNLWTPTT